MKIRDQKRSRQPQPSLFLIIGLILLAATAVMGLAPATIAQEGEQETARRADREAPPREPLVLESERLPDGSLRTIMELPAVADTYIASGRPDENFGAAALFLGYNLVGDNFGAQRMLLRFDIENNIPPGAVINEAHLQLRLSFSSPVDDEPMGTVLRRLASGWEENTVTWNTEPDWTPIDDTADVGSQLDWYEWEISEVVANWAAGVFDNDGLMILGDETVQQRERVFFSRETTTDFFPRLVIDYTESPPPITSMAPLPNYSPGIFPVSWTAVDQSGTGIAHYDVQYRVNGGDWVDWFIHVTFTSADFVGGHDDFFEFRARATDNAGNVEPFGDAHTGTTVDIQPPTSSVEPLPLIINESSFTVSWTGSDQGGSGIQYFDVQYRFNSGSWILWQQQTIANSALFTAVGDGLYEFEARAVDNVGNVEAFTNQPEANIIVDAEPPFVEPRLWLPLIFRN